MRKVRTLVRKELLDILRDKKTLIMMVVVPVLLYPLIIIGMTLGISAVMKSQEETTHTVGYAQEHEALADALSRLYEAHREELDLELSFWGADAAAQSEVRENADVWLDIETGADQTEHIKIEYVSTSQGSQYTQEAVTELLELYREELLEDQLKAEGLPESFLHPITYESEDGASFSESVGMDIGGSIGLMLIVTILLGSIYPSIDATAGEKERGTLETLLTLPVTNFQMILSKYISVSILACVTALLSVLSLGGSVLFMMFGIADGAVTELGGISLSAILTAIPVLLLTLLVTALLSTSICMCFCVFAKSFKEANNYITPVLLVIMFAAMVGMIPSVKLDYATAMIPIVNVSLMVKQIIAQQFDLTLAGMTIGVNLGCSILIVWVLAKMYDSEEVLFSDGFRRFKLFQRRADIRRGTVPDIGDLVISVTVLLLLLLYVGSAVTVRLGFAGIAVQQLLILAVPLLVVWYMKSDVKRLFSLNCPGVGDLPGSILLYLGTYCLMFCLSMVLVRLFPGSSETVSEAFSVIAEQPFALLLLVVSLMPAVGEEILFRGFLFGSLRSRLASGIPAKKTAGHGAASGSVWAVLISALVFGAFHMSLIKFLPTAMLGAAFAYIVMKTGSLFISMFLHFFNNAVSMFVMKYPQRAEKLLPLLVKERLSAAELLVLLVIGAVLTAAGIWLLNKSAARKA